MYYNVKESSHNISKILKKGESKYKIFKIEQKESINSLRNTDNCEEDREIGNIPSDWNMPKKGITNMPNNNWNNMPSDWNRPNNNWNNMPNDNMNNRPDNNWNNRPNDNMNNRPDNNWNNMPNDNINNRPDNNWNNMPSDWNRPNNNWNNMPNDDMNNRPDNNWNNMPNDNMNNRPNNNWNNMPNDNMNNRPNNNWNNMPSDWNRPNNNYINEPTVPRVPLLEFGEEYNRNREIELMRELYTQINATLYPFVVQVLNEYDFIGSPIYSPMGIDRETIAQLVDRVINLAEQSLDQVGEIKSERRSTSLKEWDRWGLLRSNVESLVLNDVFQVKRPTYFNKYAPNILR